MPSLPPRAARAAVIDAEDGAAALHDLSVRTRVVEELISRKVANVRRLLCDFARNCHFDPIPGRTPRQMGLFRCL